MLNGKELGAAIATAIELKIASGSVKSKAAIARHFGVQPPSIYDWVNKGTIGKEKLPELWRYFSDVVDYSHWGLSGKPDDSIASNPNLLALSQLRGRATPRSIAALDKIEQAAKQGRLKEADLILLEGIAARFEELNSQKS